MMGERNLPEDAQGGTHQPRAISLDEASRIADQVRELIRAGEAHFAWERIRNLHPADIGSIVAGLPRTSRDSMLRVMSPETVAWMLHQMNPVEAGRVGTRLGYQVLSLVLGQLRPQQALETLRRLPILRDQVAKTLEQPLPDTEILEYGPDTAGALMVSELPTVGMDGLAEEARDSLREMDEVGHKLTHIFVVGDSGGLVGQINMVDLALAERETPVRAIATSVVATVNLGTTFIAAATIALFESTLAQVVVLAAFLPVVAGQGGIGGTQTLTLIVRAIALGELVGVGAMRLLVREALLGLLHGVWLGFLVAAIAILWKQNLGLGLVLGIAMLGNMVIAGSIGASVPLFLRRIGVDPAVSSAVVVTTFTDVFGFLLFLGIASAAIGLIQ